MSAELQIGEVAKLFEVSTKTIRHYEKLGLLSPGRAENDYRLYTPEDILTIQRIRQLQTLGLSLKQIKKILNQDSDTQLWSTVLETLLQETQREITQLQRRQRQLQELLEDGVPEAIIGRPVQAVSSAEVYAYLAQYLPETVQAQWQQEQTIFAVLNHIHHSPELQAAVWGYLAAVPDKLHYLQTLAGQMGLMPYGYMEGGVAPYLWANTPALIDSQAEFVWAAVSAN